VSPIRYDIQHKPDPLNYEIYNKLFHRILFHHLIGWRSYHANRGQHFRSQCLTS